MWERRGAGKGPGGQEGWCWSDIIPVGIKVCNIRDPRGKWPRSSKRTLASEAEVQGCHSAIPNSRMWTVKPGTPGPQEAQERALPGIWAPGNSPEIQHSPELCQQVQDQRGMATFCWGTEKVQTPRAAKEGNGTLPSPPLIHSFSGTSITLPPAGQVKELRHREVKQLR